MRKVLCTSFMVLAAVVASVICSAPAQAQASNACDGVENCLAPNQICDSGGFLISVSDPVADPNMGWVTYEYTICSPPPGVCSGSLRAGESCLDDAFCQNKGRDTDPSATCSRTCSVAAPDQFRGLSHFNIDIPAFDTCISPTHFNSGSCACTTNVSGSCSVNPTLQFADGSCGNDGTIAKCDGTNMGPGDCITMTVNISGEETELGLGAVAVLSKESTDCNSSCMAGPWCEPKEICDNGMDDNDCDLLSDCDDDECVNAPNCGGGGGDECVTRTRGFWGTHPWITNNYAPVSVCGISVGCSGASDGESDPSCGFGGCGDIMEALGSNGGELKKSSNYVTLIAQLAAAKLNLAATAAAFPGGPGEQPGSCSEWTYPNAEGQQLSIQAWIANCEIDGLCKRANDQKIDSSGCIAALDAFNNSDDNVAQTPAPFDRPPVDDFGNVSGADPSSFTGAKNSGVVIGKDIPGGGQCKP